MRKVVSIAILLLLCILLALWSPWLYIKIDLGALFGVQRPEDISGLQVYSQSGELEVYLDGELRGTATVEKPYILDVVTPGEHLVSLKRVSEVPNSFWSFSKLVEFEMGTSVVVSYNLGPEEEFSEGHIIYATEKGEQRPSKLNIEISASDASVRIDNSAVQQINENTFVSDISLDSQKRVSISKRGYEDLEFTILPDNQEDRDRLKNFDLNIEVHLMLQPVEVE